MDQRRAFFQSESYIDSVIEKPYDGRTFDNRPYDKAFRGLLIECRRLFLPVINEVFGEQYIGDEKMDFGRNDHIFPDNNGILKERITDTVFSVTSHDNVVKRYHWEAESSDDETIHFRLWEYDAMDATGHGVALNGNVLRVTLPSTAVLYLRSKRNTPDYMINQIITPEGATSYRIPVLKMASYSLDDLFDKQLYFLLPFYIFNREKEFWEFTVDKAAMQQFRQEMESVPRRLNFLVQKNMLTNYEKHVIMDLIKYVAENLTIGFSAVGEEVNTVMLGEAYEPEITRRIREATEQGTKQGIEQGIKQGIEQGIEQNTIDLIIKKAKKGKSLFRIADEMESSEDEIRPYYNAVLRSAPEYKTDDIISSIKH